MKIILLLVGKTEFPWVRSGIEVLPGNKLKSGREMQ